MSRRRLCVYVWLRYRFRSLRGYIILYSRTLYIHNTVVVVSFFTTFPAATISIRSPPPVRRRAAICCCTHAHNHSATAAVSSTQICMPKWKRISRTMTAAGPFWLSNPFAMLMSVSPLPTPNNHVPPFSYTHASAVDLFICIHSFLHVFL